MERLAGKVVLLWGWRRALAAFLAGALAVLAQAPFDILAVCFVSFPLLVWLLDGAAGDGAQGILRRLAPAFATGWWFGFGYFLAGLWWIGNALLVEAESFAWALPLAVVALPALLALFYGFAAALARLLWTDDPGRIAALAFAFGLAEWLRATLFTGFPWNAIGYAAMPVPLLMQSISLAGLFGMSALSVFVFASPALLAARGAGKGIALALAIAVLHVGFGAVRLAGAPSGDARQLVVRVVQPSIVQSEKWDASIRDEIFSTHIGMTSGPATGGSAEPQVVIWPETSVPYLLTERPSALAAIGDALAHGQVLLAGAVRAEGEAGAASARRYYNSVIAIDDGGEIVDAADKVHLVPFGEYLPFEPLLTRLGATKIVATPQSFSPGATRRLLTLPGGIVALPLVCYEAIFPEIAAADAARADIIINVTNDAWFGNTPGPYQHFRQAQVRAAEVGIPLVRAANNGISGAVDAYGRIIDAFALNARGALDVTVPVVRAGSTLPGTPQLNGFLIIFAFGLLAAVRRLRESRSVD